LLKRFSVFVTPFISVLLAFLFFLTRRLFGFLTIDHVHLIVARWLPIALSSRFENTFLVLFFLFDGVFSNLLFMLLHDAIMKVGSSNFLLFHLFEQLFVGFVSNMNFIALSGNKLPLPFCSIKRLSSGLFIFKFALTFFSCFLNALTAKGTGREGGQAPVSIV
jgi:hypothetical protein